MNEFAHKRSFGPTPKYERVKDYNHPNSEFVIIAGSCSVESEEQVIKMAEYVSLAGATHMRGGIFRAGTYPGQNFGWIDEYLISTYHEAAHQNGLKNIIELLDYRDIDRIGHYCDCFQVGARQQQNYTLLKEVGQSGKPVFLKRNMGSTVDELLGSCEWLLKAGCKELYIIERGSSTYHNDVRWTPSIHVIPSVKSICGIPVIWDASHACGRRDIVPSVAMAGVVAGAGGVLLEAHETPDKSLSDADQALDVKTLDALIFKIKFLNEQLHLWEGIGL